jgi:hypothetical protein
MDFKNLPFAEDVNYWKTGRSGVDVWMEKTKRLIEGIGGEIHNETFTNLPKTGQSAFLLEFMAGFDKFKIIWPVLPTKSGEEEAAARRQAATLMYHDVKAKCVMEKVFGTRAAFFTFLELPGGKVAAQLASPELMKRIPKLLHDPDKED